MPVIDAIHACLSAGRTPTLAELGGVNAIASEGEMLAAAPVLDVLVQLAADVDATDAAVVDPVVLRCFRENLAPIPFRDAIDAVLASSQLRNRLSPKLASILQRRVEERDDRGAELVAAYALEALFRLALAETITPHRPLALMAELRADENGLFAVHAAKLTGAAFHIWRDGNLIAALERLAHVPDAEDEAAFELGLAWLSRALDATETDVALGFIEAARVHFDRAWVTGDGRDDALAYRATVELVQGFASNVSPSSLDVALDDLETAVRSRATWLDVANMPTWLRPRLDRDAQWLQLARLARTVASDVGRSSWLNAMIVMEQVLAVYDADRTVEVGTGLQVLLRPRIEAAFVRERGLLAHLDDLLALRDWASLRRETATELRARITALAQEGTGTGKVPEGAPLPLLRGALGDEQLVAMIDGRVAHTLEAALADHALNLEGIGNPILQQVMARLSRELVPCNDYVGQTRRNFDNLVLHILAFCKDRLDATRKERGPRGEYLFRAGAKEWDLQSDLRQWLVGNLLGADVRTEVEGVAAGRADIYVAFGTLRFIIELKRDHSDVSRASVRKYLGQAGAYQGTNVRLGILGVLDLTPRTGPPPHLTESVWSDSFVPEGASLARHLVVFRVAGRLERPSALVIPDGAGPT
ncbi:hypothetical protein WME91_03100 [Sorangium sp. So ce269]